MCYDLSMKQDALYNKTCIRSDTVTVKSDDGPVLVYPIADPAPARLSAPEREKWARLARQIQVIVKKRMGGLGHYADHELRQSGEWHELWAAIYGLQNLTGERHPEHRRKQADRTRQFLREHWNKTDLTPSVMPCTADGPIPARSNLYAADSGKVSGDIYGVPIGYAVQSSRADGDVILCVFSAP